MSKNNRNFSSGVPVVEDWNIRINKADFMLDSCWMVKTGLFSCANYSSLQLRAMLNSEERSSIWPSRRLYKSAYENHLNPYDESCLTTATQQNNAQLARSLLISWHLDLLSISRYLDALACDSLTVASCQQTCKLIVRTCYAQAAASFFNKCNNLILTDLLQVDEINKFFAIAWQVGTSQ